MKAHIYDAVSDSWVTVANTNVGKQGTSVVTMAGRIFAVGGWNDGDTDVVEEYNPKSNTWLETIIFNIIRLGNCLIGNEIEIRNELKWAEIIELT